MQKEREKERGEKILKRTQTRSTSLNLKPYPGGEDLKTQKKGKEDKKKKKYRPGIVRK